MDFSILMEQKPFLPAFRFAAGAFYDKGSLIFRTVCITNVDWNTFLTNREDRIFMKNSRTHIRKLTKFYVCNCFDHRRIIDDSRICDKESGNISPVLINVCMDSFCYQRTGNIRSATGECLYSCLKVYLFCLHRNYHFYQNGSRLQNQ